ncbi:MAG: hypothetical protein NUW23_13545 [Firmicutes bacterium]|nr:hypothetical protein [Bacillota bacterium]
MLRLVQRLDEHSLSTQSREVNGRSILSEHEQWLVLLSRALYETGQMSECIVRADLGIATYPKALAFHRIKALATTEHVSPEEGLKQLEQAHSRFPRQRYLEQDIARLHRRRGNPEAALRWYCEAAESPRDISGRITMFEEMADLLSETGRWQEAGDHLKLSWAIAVREGWQKRADKVGQQLKDPASSHPTDILDPGGADLTFG